jgi:hypothetical protein
MSRLGFAVLLLLAGCRAGQDPDLLLGRWENERDSIEFSADGQVRLSTPQGITAGTYEQRARDHLHVGFGSYRLGGQPHDFRAIVRADRLSLCELRNYRHCMQFRRPGSDARLYPR